MIEKSKAIKNGVKVLDNSAKNEFFDNLKSNFPQTIKDGKADLKAISLLLGIDKKADVSGYELTWTGKGLSNAMYSFPCNKELRLDEIYSNNPKNIIIRGDNLDALKILKSAYSEKIKMIYIDPPYNTANDNFIYPDNFREDYKAILREVGLIEIDENGEETESENLRFFKNIQGSRTHSGWLSFMLPRLKLARDLLKEDGVIFISIDDNEQANLKILCDEIFGEDNFVANIIWQKKKGGSQDSQDFAKEHEYILCYSKYEWHINEITEPQNENDFNKIINDKKAKILKLEKWGNHSLRTDRPTLYYAIKDPNGKDFYPIAPNGADGCWRKKPENLDNEHIYWQEDSKGRLTPYEVIYFEEVQEKSKIIKTRTIFTDYGTTTDATKEILNLFNNQKIFDTPKPVNLIKHFLQISTSTNKNAQGVKTPCYQGSGDAKNDNNVASAHCVQSQSKALKVAEQTVIANDNEAIHKEKDCHASARNDNTEADIILDFFAGSGTTAQAVMELNEEDGGNRQFILVQIDEEIKEEKSKSAYDFCKNELKSDKPVISDITIERVKRAANKIIKSNGAGFKVFTLSDKPEIITNEEKSLELISQRTLNNMDIIINMALTNGKTLDKKIETIFDGKLYKCEDAFYLIECDREILKFLSETQNEYILIDAYGDIELEDFLNLGAGFKERLRVVY